MPNYAQVLNVYDLTAPYLTYLGRCPQYVKYGDRKKRKLPPFF
jgi:hypothetical protein